ncbi:AMP-dependent synthetase/ligase [Arsenicicoccus sp. oral taxon 190]|uniref:AMP-dependent synthetase/ligase n=1 Tax=Arsenicicoccus sp. oral taxon 190 TaxID=1658671 RepID=UPI00067A3908|nr:long-chain fatty acid--CoA ligase [Arsenicicoccus sp. oral taxon 190]AKT51565.1 AMP-dependent synthetase [Arsenicicoccus sp. oral taxon 190]
MPLHSAHDEIVDWPLIEGRAESIGHVFRDRVAQDPSGAAFQYFSGDELVTLTWQEVKTRGYELAAGLLTLGVEHEDRVAVASTTRVEWALADLAIMCSGTATTTVYPTTIASEVAYIISDSGSRVIFAEDDAQIAKLREQRDSLPDVLAVVTFDGTPDGDWVITLDELAERGRAALAEDPELVDRRIDAVRREHMATLIYTSGTTGRPKGAVLTHDSLVYEGAAVDAMHTLSREDLQYLWLPLSHVMGKLLLALAYQIGFPTAIDGRIDRIVDNMAIVRPTFMGAAPRIFEKAYARISTVLMEGPPQKVAIARWALKVGRQVAALQEAGEPVPATLQLQHQLADRLVLSKVRARFGGRIRFMISGSAKLDPEISRWFASVGLLITEGYGLSETSSASSVNRSGPGNYSFGTVGWPVPGTEFRTAEDGEILMKGPGVMRGYHNDPDLTAQVLVDGWFHTGDIGEIDQRGFVRITDRKKDVFKTSGGKYVAPSQIEIQFKGLCPYASQFIVYGAQRSYVTALVALDEQTIMPWAEHHGLAGRSYAEVVASPEVEQLVQGYVDQLNAGLNRWETIKRFSILPRDLSVESGELTPSLKLKRKVVAERFADQIEGNYRA